jgi:hypothetical protein
VGGGLHCFTATLHHRKTIEFFTATHFRFIIRR